MKFLFLKCHSHKSWGRSSSLYFPINIVTYSEPWSGQGSWFLWPVVFATTPLTTAVWPNTQPWKNTGKKEEIISKPGHADGSCSPHNSADHLFKHKKMRIQCVYPANFWSPWHHNCVGDCSRQPDKRRYVNGATGPFWFNSIFGGRKISL